MISKIIRFIGLLPLFFTNLYAAEEIPFLQNEYDPSQWPAVYLKLSQAGTLKDVFDSGLRPYRFPGLEKSTLEVKHIRLIIELASGKNLPTIKTEWLNIKMFDDGELAHMEGATPRLSLEQARMEMLHWLPHGTRSEKNLDDYLEAVKNDPVNFDDPYQGLPDGCAVRWKEPGWQEKGGGPQCTIWFRKTFSEVEPLKLYFKISWGSNRPLRARKSYRVPIPPPPGYEHVSMEAPEKFGPDSAVDILRSQGVDIGESSQVVRESKVPRNEAPREGAETPGTDKSEISDVPDQKNPSFVRWFMGGFALLVILLLLFKTLKGKSAR